MQIDPSVTNDLLQQFKAAEALLLNLKDIIGDDEDVVADVIEGETSLLEAIERAVLLVSQDELHAKAIDDHIKKLRERKDRLTHRAELTRTAIAVAMQMACQKKLMTPVGTVTLKATPESVKVVDEAEIPARFWVASDPTLSKKALLTALKELPEGETIPGAELNAPGQTIMIKV